MQKVGASSILCGSSNPQTELVGKAVILTEEMPVRWRAFVLEARSVKRMFARG